MNTEMHCKQSACWLRWTIKGVLLAVILGGLVWNHWDSTHLKRRVNDLSARVTSDQVGATRTKLQEIDFLVVIANEHLNAFEDKTKVLDTLTHIDKIAQTLPESSAGVLQEAINMDRQIVAELSSVPLTEIWDKVDGWLQQVDSLNADLKDVVPSTAELVKVEVPTDTAQAAATPATAQPTTPSTATTQANKGENWQDKLHHGWEQLKSIVKVHKNNSQEEVFVVTTQKWFIAEKLKMLLEQLRLAAFYKDNALFHKVRLQTINWLDSYYDLPNGEKAKQLKTALADIESWNVSPKSVTLKNTMHALENLKKAQHLP